MSIFRRPQRPQDVNRANWLPILQHVAFTAVISCVYVNTIVRLSYQAPKNTGIVKICN